MKKNLPFILIIIIFSILISLPLAKAGLFLMHDDTQVARLYLYDRALKSGQFPVRWVDELGFGFGYPLFVFYPPLVYMMAEAFHLVGFSFIDSVKLVFFSSIFLSGIAMYIFAKELFGKLPALISALFYMLAPYRAIDVYIRGAMAEAFSFVWLPLILWSLYKLSISNKKLYICLAGIFLALLMITHNLIFLPFMLILPLYLTFLFWQSRNKKKFIVYCLLSIVYSLLLSAFFWIPALAEKKFTLVDQIFLATDYRSHFVYPQQLWNWPWGFGGSAADLADGISFKIGKLHILTSVAAIFLAMLHLLKNKNLSRLSISSPERGRRVTYHLSLIFFALFIFSAFMTTFYSKVIWETIKPLAYLQFPWRFLTFTALFSSILAGALLYFLRLRVLQLILAPLLIIALVIPNFKLFRPESYRGDLTDSIATSPSVIGWDISGSSFEFAPRGVELYKDDLGDQHVKIQKNQIKNDKVEVLQGSAKISNLKTSPNKLTFNVTSGDPSFIQANLFNFPGWVAKIDGVKVAIDDNNSLKLISLKAPAGAHNVAIQFFNTPLINVANAISLLSIFFLIYFSSRLWIISVKN